MGCPVPDCQGEVQPRCIFCGEHYFRLPRRAASLIFRMDFRAERAVTNEDRQYFEGQKNGYVAQAVRQLTCEGVRP